MRNTDWRGWILLPAVLLTSCAGILGPGPPKVTVHDIPERPAYRIGAMREHAQEKVYLGTVIFAMPEDRTEQVELRAAFTVQGWEAMQDWLRELLSGAVANICALKALNGEEDERCRTP